MKWVWSSPIWTPLYYKGLYILLALYSVWAIVASNTNIYPSSDHAETHVTTGTYHQIKSNSIELNGVESDQIKLFWN